MWCLLFLLVASATADNVEDIKTANNKFAPAIYKQIAKNQTGNIIVSPLSAELVLTLLELGSNGETADQLRSALYLPNNEGNVDVGIKDLLPQLQNSKSYTFNLANRIYVEKNFTVKHTFEDLAAVVFGAGAENLDFSKPSQAARTINQWVEKETNNTIQNLISSRDLNYNTAVVLVNALHFKANWSLPFRALPQKGAFYKNWTQELQVEYLYQSRRWFNYYECSSLNAQFVEVSFKGGASMVFALPLGIYGIGRLETQIDQVLNTSIPFKNTYMNVQIPKFKFEDTIDFHNVLTNLNVTKIFSRDADLSKIAGKKGDLLVSKVIQKAFIDLNESGVEAAAATYVGTTPLIVINQDPVNFVANHPFIFMIKLKGVIIFAGRVNQPKY